MKARSEVIKGVLTDFMGAEAELDTTCFDTYTGLVLDEDEIKILTNAIEEALESNRK